MELPRALRPWAAWLEHLPLDLAVVLAPLLQRIAAAVGPFGRSSRRGGGELDGFDGLDRRGSYERLLLTEWLLAEEAPDEFLRRAVMGEHSFLKPSRLEPVAERVSIALVDGGPEQLGTPRLAHLAALIVLARRAELGGARFLFGAIQGEPGTLETSASLTPLRKLLRTGWAHPPTAAMLEHWRTRLELERSGAELWLIGGPGLVSNPGATGHHRLVVRDTLELEARRLAVSVQQASRPVADLVLDLPDDATCVRLLREPMAAPVLPVAPAPIPGSAVFRPASNLVFSMNGGKLLTRNAAGDLVVFPVPNSPREASGRPRHYTASPGAVIVAAGYAYRSVLFVEARTLGPGEPPSFRILYRNKPETAWVRAPYADARLEPDAPLHVVSGAGLDHRERAVYFIAPIAGRRPLLLAVGDKQLTLTEQARDTHSFSAQSQLACLRSVGSQDHPVLHYRTGGEERCLDLLDCRSGAEFEGFFGSAGWFHPTGYGLFAVRRVDGRWSMFAPTGERIVAVSSGTVIGVVDPGGDASPGLVVLSTDRRSLWLHTEHEARSIVEPSAVILEAVCSPSRPDVAFYTEQGDVVIWSLAGKAEIYRMQTGAS